jgi:molybdopterin-guanine dinucleotide biosynthesis protein A
LAAARATQQEWLLSVPCDVPFLPLNLVMRLYDEAHTRQVDLVRAADASGTHFAIMLLHRNLLADLDEYVQLGGRKVQTWQAKHPSATVFFDEHPQVFMNINTPDDLKNAERMAHHYLGQNHIL